ncbi:MAG: hypothetical protein L0287_28035 [Anaerolineae bacterium]|nr:hypothetical protein [Anaerolineae bacterium]MCI0608850.1 hypothetical protein [Anaerolineae bacterium]
MSHDNLAALWGGGVTRRWLLVIGVVLIAGLLAFPLRGVVHQLIVVPLAYLLWLLGLLYLALPQGLWWVGVTLLVLFLLGKSLLIEIKPPRQPVTFSRIDRGKVESLAVAMQKSDRGIYFKWLVANRLGKLAYQILQQRENGKQRSVFAPLAGDGWEPTTGLQQYLEKGLHGSFADFPNTGMRYFAPPPKTSLDHDVNEVVEFLESQVENRHSS